MAKREEKSAVEKLKSRLYDRGTVGKEIKEDRPALTPNEEEAPRTWKDAGAVVLPPAAPEAPLPPQTPSTQVEQTETPATVVAAITSAKPHHPMSYATKFFIGSFIFFIGAIGLSALLFLGGVNTTSPQNIDVQIVTPSLIDGGKEATLEIIITNRNTTSLELTDLLIDYPAGARDVNDPTKALTHDRISIGTIKSGQQIKRTVSAIFYGSEGVTENIAARLEYSVAGSNAVFEKQGQASFTIGSSPVSLTIDAPTKATAGTAFTTTVTVRSNATAPVENVVVEGQFPFGFSLLQSQPSSNGNIWRLGTMKPGDTKTITLTGSVEASDGDERVFRFLVGSNTDQTDPHVKVPFLTVPQTLTVEKPFVAVAIHLEGKSGSTISVPAGKTLTGEIDWENNLDTAISGLELSLAIAGPAVDKNSIQASNGFYQSNTSTIVWTSASDPSLATVSPGGKGTYQFSFATLAPGANSTLITNPTVTLTLSMKGSRQSDSGASNVVTSAASMKVVLASALAVSAQTFRTSGPYINSGAVPPVAERDTSYTVTWTIKNSANTVANVIGQTVLPPYVKFVQGESGVTYDSGTRTVKWTLGDVKAGAGYTLPVRTASFQVVLTPSTSQVATTPALTGPLQVSGQDRFAQVAVEGSAEPVTINAEDVAGMDTVAPKQ